MNPQIKRLRAIHRLETAAQLDQYDKLIGQLARAEPLDPALLPDLLGSFFDDTEAREVMWGLVHHVEDYPAEVYVPRLAEALPQMATQAREWALLLLRRVLNDDAYRALLRDAYRDAPAARQAAMRRLLDDLVQEDATVDAVVNEVVGVR